MSDYTAQIIQHVRDAPIAVAPVLKPAKQVNRTRARTVEEQRKILALRAAGASYREISEATGLSVHRIQKHLERLARDIPVHGMAELRRQEGERLDRLQRAFWANALQGDPASATIVLRCIDRRIRLFGLDSPVQVEGTVTLTTDSIDSTMRELEAKLGVA